MAVDVAFDLRPVVPTRLLIGLSMPHSLFLLAALLILLSHRTAGRGRLRWGRGAAIPSGGFDICAFVRFRAAVLGSGLDLCAKRLGVVGRHDRDPELRELVGLAGIVQEFQATGFVENGDKAPGERL